MDAQITSKILTLLFMFLTVSSSYNHEGNNKRYKPCKRLVFFLHDIVYDGTNEANATSAIVGAPQWGNLTIFAKNLRFGNVVVFDDPLTLDRNLHSPPIGHARGQYIYDSKVTFTAWLGFSFVFNNTDYQGAINCIGNDQLFVKARDITIVGGSGDFFMHRGVATIMTDASEGDVYFRLRVDIKFYDCWTS